MKVKLGRCLLQERLLEAGMTCEELARQLHCKPERLMDYVDDKRIMPLKDALSIADVVGCGVKELYEVIG